MKRSLTPIQSGSRRRQHHSFAPKGSWVNPTNEANNSHPTRPRLPSTQRGGGAPFDRGRSQRIVTLDDRNIRVVSCEGGKSASQHEI